MNNRNSPTTAEFFDAAMQRWMAAHAVPRGSVAVTFDNRLVFAAGYGGRGVNERVPVWSLSKAITALCVASLIKDGRLRLDDPIGPPLARAFERFGKPADERLAQVTVGQLLSHRGGLPRAVDDNMFAPGLVQLLRERPPCGARIEMLLPQIIRSSLVRTHGSEFEYTNMGYILLGQIIEALTGQSYEVACTERVLGAAGIKNPAVDRDWGGIMQAESGWALSGSEYLAFARLLQAKPSKLFTAEVAEFLHTPDSKWMNPERTVAYTLGVIIRPIEGKKPTLLHSGGHNWNQIDAAGGPIDEARGTSFALTGDGIAWFASYDGFSAGTNPQATSALDQELGSAHEHIFSWPGDDDFAAIGIGPLSAEQ
jgi:CubicO group peptidase (beta-lactamase class C family)